MEKHQGLLSLSALVTGSVVTLLLLTLTQGVMARQPDAVSQPPAQNSTPTGGPDSNPIGTPEVVIPKMYQPALAGASSATTSTNSVATVYFTPQDENTSTTVLFLYNTNPSTATVGLQSYYINGSLTLSTSVAVPPLGLTRICADSVSTVSASWQNTVLINFTTFSAYAKMTLPAGVKADGYVAWDLTGTYDPLTNTQTLPLRFSTDPASVFLPSLQN
jgi:hypothetical protein